MATEGDRSLSSGISIPQWMKSKMTDKLDFEQSAFSPPENDDSFFYIRYPRTTTDVSKNNFMVNTDNNKSAPITTAAAAAATTSSNKPDFTKHTAPCQKFIPNARLNQIAATTTDQNANGTPPATAAAPVVGKLKSTGTDDGFKGEAAKCGSSVIKVAHQMVTSQLVTRGFQPRSSSSADDEEYALPPKGFDPAKRRGSKSLPSSPLVSPNSSPKSKRKLANKYFTGPFTDGDKYHGSWILSNLLGKRETLSRSVSVIAEEDVRADELVKTVSEMSIDGSTQQIIKSENGGNKMKNVYRAKPSELREMNFWSPTSM